MNTSTKVSRPPNSVYETLLGNGSNHRATHGTLGRAFSVANYLETRMSSDGFDPLLPPQEAARLLGAHRTTIWRWVASGLLSQPIRITARKVGWRRSVIEKFLADRTPGGAE